MASLARDFIRYDSTHVLHQLLTSLDQIRQTDGSVEFKWQIPEESPLRTQTSVGQYEPDGEGGKSVFGELSCTWVIQPARPRGQEHGPASSFFLVGAASTRVAIVEELEDNLIEEIAMWRMEIGGEGAPGAYFHVQVLGQKDHPPFPKSLPVPRLPTVMFTPMFAFDFLLGELFQDGWAEHLASAQDRGEFDMWRGIQTHRLRKLLDWQIRKLEERGATPWAWIRKVELPSDLFLERS